jgi:hypothetical protein
MRKKKTNETTEYWRLNSLNIKEIGDKYKDKIIEVEIQNGKVVLVLDTCRIRYVGTMSDYYEQ